MIVDMIPPRRKNRPPAERFFDLFIPEPNSGCWLWLGGVASKGYGRFSIGNREQVQAHRFSWELHYGKIPEGLWALHRCDNPPCVNPEHLFLGTCQDNHDDMICKGRKVTLVGEDGPNARLTEAQIEAIRLDPRRLRIIGADYGVDKSYVWKIKRAWHWKHSHAENPEEATRRERGHAFKAHGETHTKAKLTEADVLAIRQDARPSRLIGKLYGVSHHTVLSIRNRTIWKHI